MSNTPEFMVRLTQSAIESSLDLSRLTISPDSNLIIPVNILRITGAISPNDQLGRVSIQTPLGSAVLLGEHENITYEKVLDTDGATSKIETFLEDNDDISCRIPRDNVHLFTVDLIARMPQEIRTVVEAETIPGKPSTGQYL